MDRLGLVRHIRWKGSFIIVKTKVEGLFQGVLNRYSIILKTRIVIRLHLWLESVIYRFIKISYQIYYQMRSRG